MANTFYYWATILIKMSLYMSGGLAPRPANEEQRVKAVVKTGLIQAPNHELIQV